MSPQFILFVPHIHLAVLFHFLGIDPFGEVRRITGLSHRRIQHLIATGQLPVWVIGQICECLNAERGVYQPTPSEPVPVPIDHKRFDHHQTAIVMGHQFQEWLNANAPLTTDIHYVNTPNIERILPFEQVSCLVREFINQYVFS